MRRASAAWTSGPYQVCTTAVSSTTVSPSCSLSVPPNVLNEQ